MNARYVQRGRSIDHIPDVNLAVGDVVVQNDLVGIVRRDIRSKTLGSLAVSGVFDVPKDSGIGTEIPAGKKVYWDDTKKVATANDDSGKNMLMGKAIKPALDTAMFVRVRLSQ